MMVVMVMKIVMMPLPPSCFWVRGEVHEKARVLPGDEEGRQRK